MTSLIITWSGGRGRAVGREGGRGELGGDNSNDITITKTIIIMVKTLKIIITVMVVVIRAVMIILIIFKLNYPY